MRVRFLKEHGFNREGSEIDLPFAEANYLVRVHVAEEIKEEYSEKEEIEPAKEKQEHKTLPTAKKKKK